MNNGGKRRQLGRGLSSLLGVDDSMNKTGEDKYAQLVSISRIKPGTGQPRKTFDKAELKALAQSIKERGILQPLLLRKAPEEPELFEIIAGERRWRAAQLAELHEVPAVVKNFNDQEALEIGLIENIQRSDLAPLEEAEAFQRLIDEYGHTQEIVGGAVGKSRSYIANSLRLLFLPKGVRHYLESGKLTAGHARALLVAPEAEKLADYIVAGGLSVRATEKLVQNSIKSNENTKVSVSRVRQQPESDILEIQHHIAEALGLKVEIKPSDKERGVLTIHYETLEQFDNVLKKLTL